MKEVSSKNFGVLIAYLVPGFTTLWGASFLSETIHLWLTGPSSDGPTVGGFLYVTLAAVAAGLTVSTIRWVVIDTLHHHTGIRRPQWDFARMQQHFDAYDRLEHNHYIYYQAYANMVIAMTVVWGSWRISGRFLQPPGGTDVGFVLLIAIFFAGSRDTFRKFYVRVSNLLAAEQNSDRDAHGKVGDATQAPGLRARLRDFLGLSGW